MNGRLAKKIRKEVRRRDTKILPELKEFLNKLGFFERVKIAYRLIRGKF